MRDIAVEMPFSEMDKKDHVRFDTLVVPEGVNGHRHYFDMDIRLGEEELVWDLTLRSYPDEIEHVRTEVDRFYGCFDRSKEKIATEDGRTLYDFSQNQTFRDFVGVQIDNKLESVSKEVDDNNTEIATLKRRRKIAIVLGVVSAAAAIKYGYMDGHLENNHEEVSINGLAGVIGYFGSLASMIVLLSGNLSSKSNKEKANEYLNTQNRLQKIRAELQENGIQYDV